MFFGEGTCHLEIEKTSDRSLIAVTVLCPPTQCQGLCLPAVLHAPGSQHKHLTVLEGSTGITLFGTFMIWKKKPTQIKRTVS